MTQTATAHLQAIEARDISSDGKFVYAVKTTGIFCRPSCPSRAPLPSNVRVFATPADAEAAGFRACKRCRPKDLRHPEATLMEAACRYIDQHLEGFQLSALSRYMGYSSFHLLRKFKAALGITPRAYAQARRIAALQKGLQAGRPVTGSLYDAGFSSSSRVYENSGAHLGMTPAAYRKQGTGTRITFTIAPSSVGLVLVAQTERGVCSIALGDDARRLEQNLRQQFSAAEIDQEESPYLAGVLAHLSGAKRSLELPLDIQATAFQRRVWEQLQKIPYGETRSYSDIAQQLGQPTAARAVARACATNPVALAIPCHRVVREGGALSGYRWGLARKQALLEKERQ